VTGTYPDRGVLIEAGLHALPFIFLVGPRLSAPLYDAFLTFSRARRDFVGCSATVPLGGGF